MTDATIPLDDLIYAIVRCRGVLRPTTLGKLDVWIAVMDIGADTFDVQRAAMRLVESGKLSRTTSLCLVPTK